jgi:hypothetical protein
MPLWLPTHHLLPKANQRTFPSPAGLPSGQLLLSAPLLSYPRQALEFILLLPLLQNRKITRTWDSLHDHHAQPRRPCRCDGHVPSGHLFSALGLGFANLPGQQGLSSSCRHNDSVGDQKCKIYMWTCWGCEGSPPLTPIRVSGPASN